MKTKTYLCPRCRNELEVTSFWKWLCAPHLFDIWRWFNCPNCGRSSWMKRVKQNDR